MTPLQLGVQPEVQPEPGLQMLPHPLAVPQTSPAHEELQLVPPLVTTNSRFFDFFWRPKLSEAIMRMRCGPSGTLAREMLSFPQVEPPRKVSSSSARLTVVQRSLARVTVAPLLVIVARTLNG